MLKPTSSMQAFNVTYQFFFSLCPIPVPFFFIQMFPLSILFRASDHQLSPPS